MKKKLGSYAERIMNHPDACPGDDSPGPALRKSDMKSGKAVRCLYRDETQKEAYNMVYHRPVFQESCFTFLFRALTFRLSLMY